MQLPHLAIYVTEQDGLMLSHVMENAKDDPLEVEHPLDALNARGHDEAAKGIGRVVLGVMANWYPATMAKYPALKVPYDEREDLDLMIALIGKCVTKNTTVHFPAIEALMEEILAQKPELQTHSSISTWPETRSMLEKRAGKSRT